MAGVDQRAIDSALDRLNQMQIARMRAIEGTTAGERVTAQYLKLKAENKPAEAEALMEAHLKITRGGEKEDTLVKEIAKKKVEIAAMPETPLKQQMLASLAALEKQQGGGGATAQTGKVPPPPPGFKLN
jgi:ATP-dependent DNA ligase